MHRRSLMKLILNKNIINSLPERLKTLNLSENLAAKNLEIPKYNAPSFDQT